jgi:hypothetical protein
MVTSNASTTLAVELFSFSGLTYKDSRMLRMTKPGILIKIALFVKRLSIEV